MKYRTTQSQIIDNLNSIDKLTESSYKEARQLTTTEIFSIGNGLKQIEADVEELCSYIDTLHKTIKDLTFQVENRDKIIENVSEESYHKGMKDTIQEMDEIN